LGLHGVVIFVGLAGALWRYKAFDSASSFIQ